MKRALTYFALAALACAAVWFGLRERSSAGTAALPTAARTAPRASSTAARTAFELPVEAPESAADVRADSATLWVVVFDGDRPVAEVPVRAASVSADNDVVGRSQGVTDERGSCELELSASARPVTLWVTAEAPEGFLEPGVEVAWGTPRVELRLERAGRLYGSVRFDDGPISAAEAWIEVEFRRPDGALARTDAEVIDGAYDLGATLLGSVERIELECRGEASEPLEPRELVVGPGESVRRDLVFTAGSSLLVEVLDELDRTPLEGVSVQIGLGEPLATDAEGRAERARALLPTERQWIVLTHPGYRRQRARVSGTTPPGVVVCTLLLKRGLELTGVVVDAHGTPQPGILVECDIRPAGELSLGVVTQRGIVRDTTNAEGRFRLRGLPRSGGLQLCFLRPGAQRAELLGAHRIELPDGAREQRWVLAERAAISGRVVDTGGSAAAGVEVRLQHEFGNAQLVATSSDDGSFLVEGAIEGRWFASVRGASTIFEQNGSTVAPRSLAPIDVGPTGARGVLLTLPAARDGGWPVADVRLRFVDAADDRPVTELPFLVWVGLDSTLSTVRSGAVLADGVFIERLPAGEYQLSVDVDGFAPWAQRLDVRAPLTELEVRLRGDE